MNFSEIREYMTVLCQMASKNLDEMVKKHGAYLPFFIMFNAKSCYVRYDTQKESITDATLVLMEKDELDIVVDPIDRDVTSFINGESCASVELEEYTADTLLACIRACWNWRLSTEGLITMDSDGRFIAADLIE